MKRKYPITQTPKHPTGQRPKDPREETPLVGSGADLASWEERFWTDAADCEAAVLREDFANGKPYDLEERTARFGEAIIRFAKRIPQNPVNNRLISQLVGAGTSVGANYCEADEGVSALKGPL
jgi:hypothetical protein